MLIFLLINLEIDQNIHSLSSSLFFSRMEPYQRQLYLMKLIKMVFSRNEEDAVNIMLMVHKKGSGVCGIYTKEIAETKVFTAQKMAKNDQHPLKCVMEPE